MTTELVPGATNNISIQGNISSLLDDWKNYIDAAPATVESYTRVIRQFGHYLSVHGIARPDRQDIISYRESLKDNGLKPASIQLYLQAVKLFFQWAEQNNLYPNIASHIKGAKIDKGHKKDYLTTKQAARLLNSIDTTTIKGKRDYAILVTMLTSGLRTIEVVRADVGDLRTVADFLALFIQGKGHQEKTDYIKIVEQAEDAIRGYLKARTDDGEILKDTSPLFASASNRNTCQRMTTRSVSRIAKLHLIDVGLNSDRLTAHSLRHTAATINLLAGATVQETQQLLRHTNINTTMIYSHALERANNNSESRIASAIFKN